MYMPAQPNTFVYFENKVYPVIGYNMVDGYVPEVITAQHGAIPNAHEFVWTETYITPTNEIFVRINDGGYERIICWIISDFMSSDEPNMVEGIQTTVGRYMFEGGYKIQTYKYDIETRRYIALED